MKIWNENLNIWEDSNDESQYLYTEEKELLFKRSVKKIYLCSPDLKVRTALNGVRTPNVGFRQNIKDYDELTFTVDRYLYIDGEQIESNGYEDLKVYMYLYLEDIGYFQIQEPTISNDGNNEYKEVQAYSAEKEFEQKDWIGLKINNGETDSLEMLAEGNVDGLGFAKEFVTLCNENNHELSFIHLMLTKLPNWSVGHIDSVLVDQVIPLMEVENGNIYSIMTSNVAPRLNMIFYFDYLNFTVNAYHRDNLDFDTSVFIGFRNLANKVNISVNEDSVFTRFRVRGEDDLKFLNVNFGSDQCIDLSYFLCEPYMSQTLADKVRLFFQMQDENRQRYIELEKQAAEYNAKIDSIEYRVPSDETYWKQWDNMNLEGLQENLSLFNAEITALQVSVDTRSEAEMYDANGNYLPIMKNGQVDHELYLSRLKTFENGYGGYYTYREIITYVIPYIQTAISNINLPADQKTKYGTESEEDWSLYGYIELDAKRKNYEEDLLPSLINFSQPFNLLSVEQRDGYVNENGYNTQGRNDYLHIMDMLGSSTARQSMQYEVNNSNFKKSWSQLTADEKSYYGNEQAYNAQGRTRYLHLVERLNTPDMPGSIYYYLNELENELTTQKNNLKAAQRQLDRYAKYARFETAINTRGDPLFTEDELKHLSNLIVDSDYTNSNILATSVDTVVTMIDREMELYNDAIEKLSEVARPQYEFTVELDNLLRIPEFQGWVGELKLMRFIRLGIRDDYAVKLRIIEMEYNPCEIDETLILTFSSMITSRSGRNDLTQIIDDENNRGSKNSISIGLGNSKQAQEYVETLITMMTRNGLFSQAVRNISGNTVGQVSTSAVNNIISNYMSGATVPIKHVTGTSAEFEELFARGFTADSITSILLNAQSGHFDQVITKYLESDVVVTRLLSAEEADFGRVVTEIMNAGYINADHIIGEEGDFDNLAANVLTAGQATIDSIVSNSISSAEIDVDQLTGNYANLANLISEYIQAGEVSASAVVTALLQATQAEVQQLSAQNAFIDYLEANLVTASEIKVSDLVAKMATIDVADVHILSADSAFVRGLQSLASTTVQSVVDKEFVKDLVAGYITVADLAAGDITLSNSMKIVSENGMMVMNGTALQIMGEDSNGDPYVGIQLGYDANSNPSLILKNEDGATVLTPEGITANAIADQLIINDMIHNGTISESKLNFNVMKSGDDISIEQIYTGDGRFGAEWTNFKNGTNTAIDDLRADLEESANYDLYIYAPNGTNIMGGNIELSAKLLKNNVDVTDEFDPSCFVWTRHSQDNYGDLYWNQIHSTGEKVITITGNDVRINADFQCKFEYEDISIISD